MTGPTPRHRTFFAELKRRGVLKAAAIYGAVAFAVLQGADIVLPSLGLPERALTVLVVIALLGFPVAVALAWAYELTGRGVKREAPAVSGELDEIAAQPRTKRWLAGLLALAFVALMAGSGWWILTRGPGEETRAAEGPTSAARVVVLPFTVRGSGEYGYLGEGMVDVLSRKLDVVGELRSVDPRAVLALLNRDGGVTPGPQRGRELARRLQADYFVLGAVLEVDARLQLDASLYDADGGVEAIAEASAEGSAEDVFELVDDVATQLLLSTGAGRGAPVARIAAVTTDSLSALKQYLHGERALRAGQYLEAAEAFERAIAIDSSFALAWYRLSVASEWLTRDDLVAEAAEKAFEHSGRLSERDRRLLEGSVAARLGDHVRAEQFYRAIVGSYPDDVEAWFQLGEVLFHYAPYEGRSIAQSREAFERVLVYEPDHVSSLTHLARIAAVEDKHEELDSLVDRFLAVNPDADRAAELRVLRAFVTGDSTAQARAMAELRRASDPALLVTVAYAPVMALDFEVGRKLAGLLIEEGHAPAIRALGHIYLAYLLAAQGRLADASTALDAARRFDAYRTTEFGTFFSMLPFVPANEEQLRAAWQRIERLDPDTAPPSTHPSAYVRANDVIHPHVRAFLLGVLSARLGDYASAQRYSDQLRGLGSPEWAPSLAEDLALGVVAYVGFSRGQSAAGLGALEAARMQSFYQNGFRSPYYSGSLQRYLRAGFLEDAGRLDEALRWYSSFEQISMFDFVFLAVSHMRRAAIHERRGDLEAARRHYARFVELWANCDPELRPLVEQAKQRLAALASNH